MGVQSVLWEGLSPINKSKLVWLIDHEKRRQWRRGIVLCLYIYYPRCVYPRSVSIYLTSLVTSLASTPSGIGELLNVGGFIRHGSRTATCGFGTSHFFTPINIRRSYDSPPLPPSRVYPLNKHKLPSYDTPAMSWKPQTEYFKEEIIYATEALKYVPVVSVTW